MRPTSPWCTSSSWSVWPTPPTSSARWARRSGCADSVTGRSALTAAQRADVRSRIVAQVGSVPTLLVLDNCEHVVDEVAALVAFLVAGTRDLRVLTTTRAPLGIAAERVHQLAQLTDAEATELFAQRARSARPSIRLDENEVLALVRRLDGLPLAIELAAAKTRAMSVTQIAERLADRFGLLRGDDRGVPDRHRTLLAVIEWSWELLGTSEQSALAQLALFHDGFGLESVQSVLPAPVDALAVVEHLVAQSLLSVVEDDDGLRYRMLETVREFGFLRLEQSGRRAHATALHRAWAIEVAQTAAAELFGRRQLDALGRLRAEEANLADVLRRSLAQNDADAVVSLMAALGGYWSITGDHPRVIGLSAEVTRVLERWHPTPPLIDARADGALSTVISTTMFFGRRGSRQAAGVAEAPRPRLCRPPDPWPGGGHPGDRRSLAGRHAASPRRSGRAGLERSRAPACSSGLPAVVRARAGERRRPGGRDRRRGAGPRPVDRGRRAVVAGGAAQPARAAGDADRTGRGGRGARARGAARARAAAGVRRHAADPRLADLLRALRGAGRRGRGAAREGRADPATGARCSAARA